MGRGVGHGPLHWTGNFDEVQDVENDIRGHFGGAGFMDRCDFLTNGRSDPLGAPKAGLSADLDALADFVTSLVEVHPSPFKGEDGGLTERGIHGRNIFLQRGCQKCHGGTNFTNSEQSIRYNVGTIEAHSGSRSDQALDGFDPPSLIGLWESAPYFHDGSAKTLKEVILHGRGTTEHGNLLSISDQEIEDLVSYLKQIDGVVTSN